MPTTLKDNASTAGNGGTFDIFINGVIEFESLQEAEVDAVVAELHAEGTKRVTVVPFSGV